MAMQSAASGGTAAAPVDLSDGWGAVADDDDEAQPEYAPEPAPSSGELDEFEDFGDDYGETTSERVPLAGGSGTCNVGLLIWTFCCLSR